MFLRPHPPHGCSMPNLLLHLAPSPPASPPPFFLLVHSWPSSDVTHWGTPRVTFVQMLVPFLNFVPLNRGIQWDFHSLVILECCFPSPWLKGRVCVNLEFTQLLFIECLLCARFCFSRRQVTRLLTSRIGQVTSHDANESRISSEMPGREWLGG